MAMFVVIPLPLIHYGLDKAHHWQVYLPVVVAGFVLMVPSVIYGEKRTNQESVCRRHRPDGFRAAGA